MNTKGRNICYFFPPWLIWRPTNHFKYGWIYNVTTVQISFKKSVPSFRKDTLERKLPETSLYQAASYHTVCLFLSNPPFPPFLIHSANLIPHSLSFRLCRGHNYLAYIYDRDSTPDPESLWFPDQPEHHPIPSTPSTLPQYSVQLTIS